MTSTTNETERQVIISSGKRQLAGILNVPAGAKGVIAFAHGSGSGRFSPRNQFVAHVLQEAGLSTLLLDLLEEEEAGNREKVFDIELLAERLQSAASWLSEQAETAALRRGYFGASTGAGAALVAAALHVVVRHDGLKRSEPGRTARALRIHLAAEEVRVAGVDEVAAAIGVGVMTFFFLMFEVWFKVPLYKGLLDPLGFLGY